jgi:UDPglucose--hexose-1-phosphate uridylyltransferase
VPLNSAPEQRLDLVTGQWVVLAADRLHRPQEFQDPVPQAWTDSCAFCAGREDETTPTVASYPRPAAHAPSAWQVRVVSNLYPAFTPRTAQSTRSVVGGELDGTRSQPSEGQHEVIIESPTHRRFLTELTVAEVELVFEAYRDRWCTIGREGRYAYAVIFKNSGRDAGMSREHLHSQLVALPHVPPVARLELDGAQRFLAQHRMCVYCHLYDELLGDDSRWVGQTDEIVAFCPYASRVAYEVWLMPKRHQAHFEQTSDAQLRETSLLIWQILRRLETCLGPTAYNYVIHSNPFDSTGQDHYHWHIEILPRTGRLAGLEWGTGVLINTVPPEAAARQLRDMA